MSSLTIDTDEVVVTAPRDAVELLWGELSGPQLLNLPVEPMPADHETSLFSFRVKRLAVREGANLGEEVRAVCAAVGSVGGALALVAVGRADGVELSFVAPHPPGGGGPSVTLGRALQGQFPGAELEQRAGAVVSELVGGGPGRLGRFRVVGALRAVPQVSRKAATDGRGVEVGALVRFVEAMRGRDYVAMFLAEPLTAAEVDGVVAAQCEMYTLLSELREETEQLSGTLGEQRSVTESEGWSRSLSESVSRSVSTTHTRGQSTSWGKAKTEGKSTSNTLGGGVHASANANVGVNLPFVSAGVGRSVGASVFASRTWTKSESETDSRGGGTHTGTAKTASEGTSEARTDGVSGGSSQTVGGSVTVGSAVTRTRENRAVRLLLERLDRRIQRLDTARPHGVWRAATYLLADDEATVATGLGVLQGVYLGDDSSAEAASTAIWRGGGPVEENFVGVARALERLQHPRLRAATGAALLSPAALLSSAEVGALMALPGASLPGVPVSSHPEFGAVVSRLGEAGGGEQVELGAVSRHGRELAGAPVPLDVRSLSGHVLVTGSTGSGKSNTTRHLLRLVQRLEPPLPFLVIEPVKDEYRALAGGRRGATLLTAGDPATEWLCLNPMRFPAGTHVLSHIDRLTQLFNAAFPMYASMPALLEEAVRRAYVAAGWDLSQSRLRPGGRFPTFADVLGALDGAVEDVGYSGQVQADFVGALRARLRSLTRGLRGQLLCPLPGDETPDEVLFERPCVVNLRLVASPETKALVMGALLIRLREYREEAPEPGGRGVVHVTVLEEAHTLLRRTSTDVAQDGANLRGMAVEMFTDAIAELRSKGEAFVIVDQSPTTLDPGALKHTNTKIVHRLPYAADREEAAASLGASDAQRDELGRLPTGVAAVYKNDWLEPVLCKVTRSPLRSGVGRRPAPPARRRRLEREQALVLFALGARGGDHPSHADGVLRAAGGRATLARELARRLGVPEAEPHIDGLFDPRLHADARAALLELWGGTAAQPTLGEPLVDALATQLGARVDEAVRRDVDAILAGQRPLEVARRYFW